MQHAHAIQQIARGYKFWMLACHQQQIAEALPPECMRFLNDFFARKSDAQDCVVARKAAILAIVDTLVRQVQRSKEPNHFAESLPRDLARVAAKRFKRFA